MGPGDTFPRQYARTRRLTLGEPRTITVSPDDQRVVFVRSRGGNDPVNCLWVMDAVTGAEKVVADPRVLLANADDEDLPAEERARRERAREGAGGVVAYGTDAKVTVAAFALSGRLFAAGLISASARELNVDGPVFDPRPDPKATRIAYVSGATLRIAELDGSSWELAGETDDPDVTWGQADFIAAEEMGRSQGYWWSPDGARIAACRVDNSPVARWWISDPAHPERPAREHPYPAAGTDNPLVELHILAIDGERTQVRWDRAAFPYLARVSWDGADKLLVTVQSRDQRTVVVLQADADSGTTAELWRDTDDVWVELYPGGPGRFGDGQLVTLADRDGARRLLVGGEPVTPDDLQVRSIIRIKSDSVLLHANPIKDPTVTQVVRWTPEAGVEALTAPDGVYSAVAGGSILALKVQSMVLDQAMFMVAKKVEDRTLPPILIKNRAEDPLVDPNVRMMPLGPRGLATAVLLPRGVAADAKLPVLMDPYGGPHAQRVVAARGAYLSAQWFADQGFAVVIVDGRGTPGRGSEWERAVHRDLAQPVLDDQVEGLRLAAKQVPQIDLTRVAIRGWSFGGYLAALAVLRRPDVFHAAVAGAPVTEWRLYDTHYTERYLGDPNTAGRDYDRSSLLVEAERLTRPLMLIHGLADDNVVAAHTLQFSSALLAAGRPHEVLPLSGVSHMTPQEVVAENLLLLQLDFIRRSLGLTSALTTA